MKKRERIVVGVSGASGMPVAYHLLSLLKENPWVETHLVISESAKITIQSEMEKGAEDFEALADQVYGIHQIGAAIASGSFETKGMIVVPCSMKTAAGIASGYTDNLLLRAADCTIKERRPLVLAVRECPLSRIHLRNLELLSSCGADILPMVMTFYHQPKSIQDMIAHIAAKALDRFGIESGEFRRWIGGKETAEIKQ